MIKHKALTDLIIKTYFEVYNALGYGFLERVYQNAMYLALKNAGLEVVPQQRIQVYYKNEVVGDFFADIIVNDVVILELKATSCLLEVHEMQLINYLKATNIEIGLLLNFGTEPEFCRKMWVNERKPFTKAIRPNDKTDF
jgi:GxxExxY protein